MISLDRVNCKNFHFKFHVSLKIFMKILIPVMGGIIIVNIYYFQNKGGMKGVIWTDVFQTIIMIIGLIVVITIGSSEVGGISNVFEIGKKGGRLHIFE